MNPSDNHHPTPLLDHTQPLTFTPEDALYLGQLLLVDRFGEKEWQLKQLKINLSELERMKIRALVERPGDINIDAYFDPEGYFNSQWKGRIPDLLTRFAAFNADERQVFLENNQNAQLMLGPLSHLSLGELRFWHQISHNDLELDRRTNESSR